jgi:uncharacterized protein
MVAVVSNPISDNRILYLNVGFLLAKSAGYSREISFDHPEPIRAEDVIINHLHGSLRLTRTPQGILMQGRLQAQTPVECVRCLRPFEQTYEVEISELFVLSTVNSSNTDPYVINEGGIIDLTPIVREEGILAVPMQVLCSPGCKGLCAECGADLNEGPCGCEEDPIDPRLASLRMLLKK